MGIQRKNGPLADLIAMLDAPSGEAEKTALYRGSRGYESGHSHHDDDDDDDRPTNQDDFIDHSAETESVRVNAKGGDDTVLGGSGNDRIDGGDGNDSVLGGEGRDRIEGDDGDDFLSGEGGDDRIEGDDGNDTILGGDGEDEIDGGKGDDSIDGGGDDDEIDGGKGDDTVLGGSGNDEIDGGKGDDVLEGGEGDDEIEGGKGTDTAVFNGSILDFSIEETPSGGHSHGWGWFNWLFGGHSDDDDDAYTVTDMNTADGDEGTDALSGVEVLQFDDYTLNLDGSNNGPMIVATDQTTDEDTATAFSAAVYDFDGDTISIDNVSFTGAGSFTFTTAAMTPLLGSGVQLNFAFDPDGAYDALGVGETQVETVTVEVSDGNGGSQTVSFDVTITGVNDPPVAVNDTATTPEDTAVDIIVLDNDDDVDGDTLTVTLAEAANGGVVINGDGTLTYTPDENFNGEDTITYTISDGNGGEATATVTVTVDPVNDDPTAGNDIATTPEDTAVDIIVLDNDDDVDGDTLTVILAEAANGDVVINGDGTLTYTPDENFNGEDTITYTISDGNGGEATATVTVTVDPVNDDPTAGNDTAETDQGVATDIVVLDNDDDLDGDDLTVILADAANGDVEINLDGTLTYTPDAGYFGEDTITYTISDGNGGEATATVAVTVNQVGPTVLPDTAETDEDESVEIFVLANDTDPEGGNDLLIISAVAGNGSVDISAETTLTYTPDPDFNGEDTITYTVRDANGNEATTTVTVTVNPVNDAPEGSDPDAPGVVINEVDGAGAINLIDRTSDVDGDTVTVFAARFIDPETETVYDIPVTVVAGIASFDPAAFGLDTGESLTVQLEYFMEDDSGAANDQARGLVNVTINGDGVVVGPNGAPTAGPVDLLAATPFEEADGTITFDLAPVTDDPDGDTLTVVTLVDSEGNEIEFTQVGETIEVDPQQFGLATGEAGVVTLTYTVDDGSGAENSQASSTIQFNLNGEDDGPPPPPTNIAPTANALTISGNEVDGNIVIDLNAEVADADGDELLISAVRVLGGIAVDFTMELGVLTIDTASLGLDDGETLVFDLEYDVQDDSGQVNNTTTATINVTVDGFTETPPPPPATSVVLDFEPYSSDAGLEIDIAGASYEGFVFSGNALVIETDEISGGRGGPSGIVLGQTTPGGDNVLVGSATTTTQPLLDEFGAQVLDERGNPVLETVPDELFGFSSAGTVGIEVADGVLIATLSTFALQGSFTEIPDLAPYLGELRSIDDFSLDSMSLNLANGDGQVSVTTYGLQLVETFSFSSGGTDYYTVTVEIVEIDTFVFNIDASTDGTELVFDASLSDVNGNTDFTAFDDIIGVTITADDGSAVVLDDILLTY